MRRSVLLGALLAAAASFVILYDLGGPSVVNGDEAVYHDAARQMQRTGDWLRWTSTGPISRVTEFRNGPVQYWLRIAAMETLGDNATAARSVSALAGIAAVLAVFAFARRRAGDAAGLVAGLIQLTTVHFVYLHGARTGELDAIVSLGSLLCLAAFVRDLTVGKSFWLTHLALVVLANFKAPLIVPIAASQLLVLALTDERSRLLRCWSVTALLVWPVGLAWHWMRLLVLGSDAWAVLGFVADRAIDSPRSAGRAEMADRVVFYARAFVYGCFPWAPVHAVAALAALRSPRPAQGSDWRRAALAQAGVLMAFFVVISHSNHWYLLAVYPLFAVVSAEWLVDRTRDRGLCVPALAAAAAVALVAAFDFDLLSLNPFAISARLQSLRATPWLESPLATAVVFLVSGSATYWAVGRLDGRRAALALVAGLLVFASIRTAAPLRWTGHVSGVERAALRLQRHDGTPARGRWPMKLPSEGAPIAAIYYFLPRYELCHTEHALGPLLVMPLGSKNSCRVRKGRRLVSPDVDPSSRANSRAASRATSRAKKGKPFDRRTPVE